MQLEAKVDLTNCDRGPTHIPGAILPHGAMLVINPETLVIGVPMVNKPFQIADLERQLRATA